jgi:hypothetical protein
MKDWLSMLLSEAPGEPSIRRVALAGAMALALAVGAAGIFRPVDEGTRNFALALVGAALGAVTAGRFAEALEKK